MSHRLRSTCAAILLSALLGGCRSDTVRPTPTPAPPVSSAPAAPEAGLPPAAATTTTTTVPAPLPAPRPAPAPVPTTTLAPTEPVAVSGPTASARSWLLNRVKPELDGQTQGMLSASDGALYFGASTRSGAHGAAFFRLPPGRQEPVCLSPDVTTVCGGDPMEAPQGAVRGPMAELEGWVYFAAQFASERQEAEAAYPGAHVLGCEMSTGRLRDLGLLRAGHTISGGVACDAPRRRLYVLTTPLIAERAARGDSVLIHRIELPSGRRETAAEIRTGSAHESAGLFVDRRGDAWFTLSGKPGTLYRLRALPGAPLEEWPGVLPPRYALRAERVLPDAEQADRAWTWVGGLPDGDRAVFTASEDGMLWLFDASRAAANPRAAFTPLRHIGPTGPGIAIGGERLYYVQRALRREGTRAPRWSPDLHLLSVCLRPGGEAAISDHGLLVDGEGRRPWRIESLAADASGRVYLCGDWHLRKGETAVRRYVWRGRDAWQLEPRRLFLAMVRVSAERE